MQNLSRYRDLLSSRELKKAAFIVCLMIVGMFLETAGVALIGPTIGIMSESDLGAKYPKLAPLLHVFGNSDYKHLVTAMMLLLVSVYVTKAIFLTFLSWQQYKFIYECQAALSQRLFAGYMRQPWAFHLSRNSAEMVRNTTTEIQILTTQGLTPLSVIVTEFLVLAGIVSLLLVAEPIGSVIVIFTLGAAAITLQRVMRSRLGRWGQARRDHERRRIQLLQEGLGGVKEIKLLGREDDFLARYAKHATAVAQALQRQMTIQQLPRTWLEMLLVIALAVLVLTMMAMGRSLSNVVPVLALFVAAAFRLIPSASRLVMAFQSLRYSEPAVAHLHAEIAMLEKQPQEKIVQRLPFCDAIRVQRVTFSYLGAAAPSLRSVDLTIEHGASVGFVGTSGAGKSTLVDIVLGLHQPSGGEVLVDGKDIRTNLRGWQQQIGYVPQNIFLTDDTLRRNIALGVPESEIEDRAIAEAIAAAQLTDFVNGLSEGVNTFVGERGVRISGGQRQRIGIARALYHNPSVLVLDEATSALDSATEQDVMRAVNALRGKKTMLIIAHRLSTLVHCDRIFRMEAGHVAGEGTYGEIVGSQSQTA